METDYKNWFIKTNSVRVIGGQFIKTVIQLFKVTNDIMPLNYFWNMMASKVIIRNAKGHTAI